MAEIEFDKVSKVYDDGTQAVHDLDLGIEDGELMVVVGPSGCGKTTALRMLAGLEEITDGEIRIGERVVNDLTPKERDVAMVFQNYALYPHMTVGDNIGFSLRVAGMPKAERDSRVRAIARTLGLENELHRRPRQLSGGQRQRVALGRAIVRNPRVFLFDEPLSNLDAALRVQMRVELKRLHDRLDTTAIYVTHDQVEAMTLGDRVVVMKDGTVQQEGAPLTLYQRPANRFVAGFIGSPAMNFVPVTLEWSEHALWARAPGLRVRVPAPRTEALRQHVDKKVILGLRPEALHPASGADGADYAFEATVEVVEPLGSEILLDTRVGEVPVVARVEPGVRVSAHDRVRLSFDPARAHFFDAGTEAAI